MRAIPFALLLAACTPAPFELAFVPLDADESIAQITDFDFVPGTSDLLLASMTGGLIHARVDGDDVVELGRVGIPLAESGIPGCGLQALTVDPDFQDNGFVWVSVCQDTTTTAVLRLTVDLDDLESVQIADVIRSVEQDAEAQWHQFFAIDIEEDGTLLVGLGDQSLGRNARDEDSIKGSILRVAPDRTPDGSGYTIPEGNGDFGQPEMFAMGVRSPWKVARDDDGLVWVGDVGAQSFEEVNRLDAPGADLGWNIVEGECAAWCRDQADDTQECLDQCEGFQDPDLVWDHSTEHPFVKDDPDTEPRAQSLVFLADIDAGDGPDPYRGAFDDGIVFSDMCRGWWRFLPSDGETVGESSFIGHLADVTAARRNPDDGFVYFGTFGQCSAKGDPIPFTLFRAIERPQ